MALPRKLQLDHEEVVVTEVYPSYVTKWYLYCLGFLVLGATAFFASWWLKLGIIGYGIGLFGFVFSAVILYKAWQYNRQTYWVLTTLRLIDVAKTGLWQELITSLTYSKIDDVIIQKRGISAKLLNRGTVIIKVADDDLVYTLDNIRNPEQVQHMLLEHRDIYSNRQEEQAVSELFQSVLKALPELSDAQLLQLEKRVQTALDKRVALTP